jgi:hypothetical protein
MHTLCGDTGQMQFYVQSLINSTKSSIPFDLYSDMHGDRYIYIHAG